MSQEPTRRLDGYGSGEMAIPTWVLLQNTGGDWPKSLGGLPGQFHNTGSDEIVSEFNIIVVDILMGRARWSVDISDQGPLCVSLDAQGDISVNGDKCSECEYRLDQPWSVEASERRKMCCLNYTILGITLNDLMPCIIRAHGISALPIRQLITQLRLNRTLKGEYHRAAIGITSQEKTGKAGAAFAIHPRIIELITEEQKVLELKAQSNALLGAPIPLPEGRPEEPETPPLGFTPEGIPFWSEAERDRLMGAAPEPGEAKVINGPIIELETAEATEKPETPAPGNGKQIKESQEEVQKEEPGKTNLDLDF